MKAYRITKWNELHETHESRKIKYLKWVPVPVRDDSLAFSMLKSQPARVDLYCAWMLMVQLASKPPAGLRGWLVRKGEALTVEDMGLLTGFEESIFAQAVEYFCRPEVGWLRLEELSEAAELPKSPKVRPLRARGKPGGPAGTPADHAGTPGDSAGLPAEPAGISKDQGIQSTTRSRRPALVYPNEAKEAVSSVAASKMQWAAINSRIKALEKRSTYLNPADYKELRGLRTAMAKLQEKQSKADWSLVTVP